ncbi:unnamed protein product [Spirodela intermedia]|uniref:Fibronectin type-III domain-containing protein n=1 Tax=Spirodela intermedia TaxID=51605 RepID=A0A7I8J890_SPIIN|nr:unnamed protein product [Spirodela intermedia]CAA6666436.1 unnamed protein product [Spirodela intermedia]
MVGNPPDSGNSKSWVCMNSACKAVLSSEDTFCKRCSCCICHLFDDNKDPTLWLVCGSDSSDLDSCGLSCHVECAIQHQKAGVVNLGESLQLDGSYCCASCGKVSGIFGFWRKQLAIAKDARRVDILCYRISLSYRLLEGTSHFKIMHEVVSEAKAKLETEVGPVSGVSAKMARGIVSRLSVAGDVQKLCSLAIEKADQWLSSIADANPNGRSVCCNDHLLKLDFLPAACRFHFEDITSSTMVIVLKETSSLEGNVIEGYKLWYCNSREQETEKMPVIFPKNQRRILISNLQPCTEYTFRIISFTESGDLGHSESKCFTRSVEIIQKISEKSRAQAATGSSGFKVRNLGKILRLAWAHEHGGLEGFRGDSAEGESCRHSGGEEPEGSVQEHRRHPSVSCGLNLNMLSALGMNPEFLASIGCSDSDAYDKNGSTGSDTCEDSQTWTVRECGEIPAVESKPDICRKRTGVADEEMYDGDSTLVNASPPRLSNGCSGRLDDHYEYCVKILRWLECERHIGRDFRMKFLTWFSLRSTEQERRVVHTYIDTLVDDPGSLAGQLVDSFSGIVTCKRLRNGSCGELCAADF